ncbi:MAG: hypothetical protein HN948_00445, partial [Clostridia bacterium]|nr:hypothetical protein [Clostridia bacterium]
MELKQKVMNFVDENQEQMFEMLSKLVQINSENFVSHGNEKECALAVQKIYEDFDLIAEY